MAKVTVRTKPMANNRQSLYLDFYPAIIHPETGKETRREFLNLSIYDKPKTAPEKAHNKETLTLAENIKAKRQLAIQAEAYDFLKKAPVTDVDFLSYFNSLGEKQTEKNKEMWFVVSKYLVKFTGGELRSNEVNVKFCNDFKAYLQSANSLRSKNNEIKLSENTVHSYFKQFRLSLKHAFNDGILKENIFPLINPLPQAETQREYLYQEELQALAHTPCNLPQLKEAALFSALTGLRFSDIEKMKWSELRHSDKDGYYIQFTQQKTKGTEVQPISDLAFSLLGIRGKEDSRVFDGLKYSAYTNLHLKQWVLKAGITKDITFHSFRHTYATLLLSNGIDIFTVSKMLGHREIETTKIYAKIMDKSRRAAANSIQLNF